MCADEVFPSLSTIKENLFIWRKQDTMIATNYEIQSEWEQRLKANSVWITLHTASIFQDYQILECKLQTLIGSNTTKPSTEYTVFNCFAIILGVVPITL